MDVLLGIVAGLAVAGCVWLLIGRGKLAARAARAEATAEAREGEAARLAGGLGAAIPESGGGRPRRWRTWVPDVNRRPSKYWCGSGSAKPRPPHTRRSWQASKL